MLSRCYRPNHHNFKYYGGRGIKVCQEWIDSPQSFIDWAFTNGWEPGLEIDRINNDKGYSPDNCRFVSHWENVRNSPSIKLSILMIKEIKRLLRLKVLTHEHIAFIFNVNRTTVTRINSGLRHADV